MNQKKLFMAVAIACGATTAHADFGITGEMEENATWEVKVGGFYNQFLGYADPDIDNIGDSNYDGLDTFGDGELHFNPSITLDNGLKFGAHIELEANSNSDQIDETYLFIKGSFGEILIGSENSAGYLMHYAAPRVVPFAGDTPEHEASLSQFIPFSGFVSGSLSSNSVGDDFFRGSLGTTYLENARNNDAERITYFTPRFAGFQIGVSYARDGSQDSFGRFNCDITTCEYIDLAANFTTELSDDLTLNLSARYGQAELASSATEDDPTVFGVGAEVITGPFTFGASFAEQDDGAVNDQGEAFDIGVKYDLGKYAFSLTYFDGENIDDENVALEANENYTAITLGASKQLLKGVNLLGYIADVQFEEDLGDAGAGSPGDDVDGFIIGTGLSLRF